MQFLIQLAITVVSWLAIMFVSTNLIGIWVGGITPNAKLQDIAGSDQILRNEIKKSQRMQFVIATVLLLSFLTILFYFWNLGLVIAALMLMASRIPDVIWEMKSSRSLEIEDMKKPKLWLLTTLLSWASIPVVWYSIARL
jgi:hypothetical protein